MEVTEEEKLTNKFIVKIKIQNLFKIIQENREKKKKNKKNQSKPDNQNTNTNFGFRENWEWYDIIF